MALCVATSADGIRIAFEVAGSGSPLILLHGLPGSAAGWREMGYVAQLALEFRVISIEGRGHGRSDKPRDAAAYGFERIAADVVAVADACGVDQFRCIGSSWGANTALRLAASNDRVTQVVAIGGVFGKAMSEERAAAVSAWWNAVIDAQRDGRLEATGLSAAEREEIKRVDPDAVVAAALGLLAWPNVEPEQLSVPTLLIVGGEDEPVLSSLDLHRDGMKKVGIAAHVLAGLDHRQTVERCDLTLPLIQSFLRNQPRAR